MIGRVALLWVNEKVRIHGSSIAKSPTHQIGERRAIFVYALLAIGFATPCPPLHNWLKHGL